MSRGYRCAEIDALIASVASFAKRVADENEDVKLAASPPPADMRRRVQNRNASSGATHRIGRGDYSGISGGIFRLVAD